jgi:hypothetical protein
MGHVRTSAISYWRGVPKSFHTFGYFTLGNYPIVQPQQIILNKLYKNKDKIRSDFIRFNNNYRYIQNRLFI